jgi:hypothetical protein
MGLWRGESAGFGGNAGSAINLTFPPMVSDAFCPNVVRCFVAGNAFVEARKKSVQEGAICMAITVLLSAISDAQAYIASLHFPSLAVLIGSLPFVLGGGNFGSGEPPPSPLCERCGKTGSHGDRFCGYCGGDLDIGQVLRLCPKCGVCGETSYCTRCGGPTIGCVHGHQLPSSPRRLRPDTCRMCSNGHVSYEESYCGKCGGRVTERSVAHLECPSCGHIPPGHVELVDSSAKFCTNCGAAMQIRN